MDSSPIFSLNSLFYDQATLSHLRLLIVGVGGIGCQLLKVLCKMTVGQIHIIDMDTIEISNLNRQFLFKAQHKGQSKALVAKQTIKVLNPYLNIEAHHKNIRQLPISFFQQFSFLIMALDNIETRNYVNKIGVRLDIPVIDAGTLGYKGNVHIIMPHQTRCYSCEPKVTSQKSFPVCTIRMRPEKPIHCIVWAKMLFQVFFSGQQVNNDMKDLSNLLETADEKQILSELFNTQIENIKVAKTQSDSFLAQDYLKKIKPISLDILNQSHLADLDNFDAFDSKNLDIKYLASIARSSLKLLLKQKNRQGSIIFEKDDDTIIHFISSFANIRMLCFSIQQESFNEVKNMAGNIVPAIASTNSIVSGIQVNEMIKLIENAGKMKSYYIQNQNYKVRALKVQKPLESCLICSQSSVPLILEANMSRQVFNIVIDNLQKTFSSLEMQFQFSINLGSKQLYNSEQPNEKIKTKFLTEISEGSYELDLKIVNQDESQTICNLWIIHNEELQSASFRNTNIIERNIKQNIKRKKQKFEKMSQSPPDKKQESDDSSQCGVVDPNAETNRKKENESDDELMIVQVKNEKAQNASKSKNEDNSQDLMKDEVRKRIKQY